MQATKIKEKKKASRIDWKKETRELIWYIGCALLAFVYCFPFIYMLFSAFQPNTDLLFVPNPQLIPDTLQLGNIIKAFNEMNYLRALGNTLFILCTVMVLNLVASSLVAYGFSRFNVPEKKYLFGILISTMMLPWIVTFVPSYVIYSIVGLTGTFAPLIIGAIGGSAYNVFMIRQYLMGIPKDLDEAAKIDGCSSVGILFRILLPNMKPIYATLIIFLFSSLWSDWVGPNLYLLSNKDMWTLSMALKGLEGKGYVTDWTLVMSGSILFVIPTIIVLFSAQKYFMEGVVGSSFK